MEVSRRQRFVNAQIALMLGTILVLSFLGILSLELFVIASLLGLMLLTLATAPVKLVPRWRGRLKWPLLFGFIVFIYLLAREVFSVIQTVF
jgi:hypothetical protein